MREMGEHVAICRVSGEGAVSGLWRTHTSNREMRKLKKRVRLRLSAPDVHSDTHLGWWAGPSAGSTGDPWMSPRGLATLQVEGETRRETKVSQW